jgi:hypothetical protein
MMYAESRSECEAARTRFATEYRAKYPKAVDSLAVNWEQLTAFFDFPAEHWKHLRTTNVIESAFATVRLRERATEGAGSRTKGLLMAFKLLDMAQQRWRRLDGTHLLPRVHAGVRFVDGVQKQSSNAIRSTDNSRSEGARSCVPPQLLTITCAFGVRSPWCLARDYRAGFSAHPALSRDWQPLRHWQIAPLLAFPLFARLQLQARDPGFGIMPSEELWLRVCECWKLLSERLCNAAM